MIKKSKIRANGSYLFTSFIMGLGLTLALGLLLSNSAEAVFGAPDLHKAAGILSNAIPIHPAMIAGDDSVNPLDLTTSLITLDAQDAITLPTPQVVATVTLPLGIGFSPIDVEVHPDTGYIYVACDYYHVYVITGTQIITRLSIRNPEKIVIHPENGYVYIAGDELYVISGTQIITQHNFAVSSIAVHPDTGYVYATSPSRNAVAIISGTQIMATLDMERRPVTIQINPSSGYAYVVCTEHEISHVKVVSGTQVLGIIWKGGYLESIKVHPADSYIYIKSKPNADVPVCGTITLISGQKILNEFVGNNIYINPVTGYAYMNNCVNGLTVLSGTRIIDTLVLEPSSLHLDINNMLVNPDTGYIYIGSVIYRPTVVVVSGTQVITTTQFRDSWLPSEHSPLYENPSNGYVYGVGYDSLHILSSTLAITSLPLGQGSDLAIHPNTGYVYVTRKSYGDVIVVSGTQVITKLPTIFYPSDVKIHPDTGFVYVSGAYRNEVAVMSGTQVIATIPVGKRPNTIEAHPNSGLVYVANGKSDTVTVISDTTVIATLPLSHSPTNIKIHPDTGYVYIATADHKVVVCTGFQITATLALDNKTRHSDRWRKQPIAVSPVTGYIYVGNREINKVAVISGTQIVAMLALHKVPETIKVHSTSGYVYIEDIDRDTVTVISGTQIVTELVVDDRSTNVLPHSPSEYIYVRKDLNKVVAISGKQIIKTFALEENRVVEIIETSPNTGYTYVASSRSPYVTIISGTKVITELIGPRTEAIDVDPYTGRVYLADTRGVITIIAESPPRPRVPRLDAQPTAAPIAQSPPRPRVPQLDAQPTAAPIAQSPPRSHVFQPGMQSTATMPVPQNETRATETPKASSPLLTVLLILGGIILGAGSFTFFRALRR